MYMFILKDSYRLLLFVPMEAPNIQFYLAVEHYTSQNTVFPVRVPTFYSGHIESR